MKRLLTAVALLALLVPSLGQAAVINLTDTDDLVTEVTNANPNDQLVLADGTYTVSSQLNINKALTITGNDEAGVILDCSAVGGYGISVTSGDVTLENFTMLPPTPNYPIHASGTSNPPNGFNNLTIQHMTIEGTHQRTSFDIQGYNHVVLSHLTSKDATAGNGLSVTGCTDVDIDNITTANNAWGSIAVYVSTSLNRGSDDVVIIGNTLTLGEAHVYQQDENGLVSTNVSVTGYEYVVFNDEFRLAIPANDSEGYTFFEDTQSDALSKALIFTGYEDASSIQRLSDGHWVVGAGMSIQTAVDDATAGDTVEVLAGTYPENVVVDKTLDLLGAQAGVDARGRAASESIVTASSGPLLDVQANGVVVDGFEVTGTTGAGRLVDCEDFAQGFELRNSILGGVGASVLYFGVSGSDIFLVQNAMDASSMTSGGNGDLVYFDGGDVYDNLTIEDNDLLGGEVFAGDKTYNSDNMSMTGNLFDGASLNLSSQFRNSLISDNTFQNNGYTHGQVGLLNSTISDNTFHVAGPSPASGYPSYGLMLWGDQYSLTPSENVSVTGNTFYVNGIAAPDEPSNGLRILSGIDASTITVTGNNFLDQGLQSGAFGLVNQGSNAASASCNWWDSVAGPDALPTSPNPSGAGISGSAVFWPWLDATAPGGTCNQYGNNTVAANPSGEISACDPCVTVPIDLSRTDTSALRGVSVTFQLSSELELCGNEIQIATGAGSLYDGFTDTQIFVVDNGGGSYTADVSILGLPCGVTTDGTVVTVDLAAAPGVTTDTAGTITVTGVTVRDCDNLTIPGIPGAPTSITINNGAPGAVADLSASQLKIGNDSNGTTKINLSWTDPSDPGLATIEIYRKGFGSYPEYDDDGGVAPTAPPTPGAGGWSFVASVPAGTGSYQDEPGNRDFWYYVVFANDGCNDGAVSNRTSGTLNYHLGDVAPDNWPTSIGNNIVLTNDISALGDAYGTAYLDGSGDYNPHADVGPTTDNFVYARPTTDNQIQFEDLLMFAINYSQVSKRPDGLASAGRSDLQLMVPALPAVGETFEVSLVLAGDGTVHGLSTDVSWNDAQVEYLGFAPGELMNRQGTYAPVFSPKVGRLDAAVFGTEKGILGEGTMATLRFRVRESGDAGFTIAGIDARNGENQEASIGSSVVSGAPGASTTAKVTQLLPNVPNPFNPATEIHFVVGQKGPVSVQIYSLQGRLVRTLVQEPMDAGERSITWHGRDDSGRSVASGTYVVRVDGPDRTHTRNIVLLK